MRKKFAIPATFFGMYNPLGETLRVLDEPAPSLLYIEPANMAAGIARERANTIPYLLSVLEVLRHEEPTADQ